MLQKNTCPACGAGELVPGAMQSTGTVHFRPSCVPFLSLRTADVAVRGAMCPNCGTVTLIGDAEKLQLILQAPGSQNPAKDLSPASR